MGISVADRLAIHELMARAAYGYDERDLQMLESCFAVDARMSMRIGGGDLIGPFEGREAIMGLMSSSMAEQSDVRRHVISNLFFMDESDRPQVVTNLTLLATENGAIQLLSAGVYTDSVVQVDGQWQIAERFLALDKSY